MLHTSDWHLGQNFHGHDRSREHQCFLDWLLDTLESEAIDVLLIAGDIYDQPHPAAETQRQFYAFLRHARQRCPLLQIIAIAGNHDSPARLEAPLPLLQALGVEVVGQVDPARPAELLRPLRERDGRIGAWCLAVPYLRPADLPRGRAADGSETSYASGVAAFYRNATSAALQQRESGQALVALGHLHVEGGRSSHESERRLVIGGAEGLDAALFDPALAYVALGHLHLAQQAGDGRIRYCGSPLPLSFGEIEYPHQVLKVELAGGQLQAITSLPVPRPVELLRVPRQPAPASAVLAALAALELPDAVEPGLRSFVEVQLALDQPEPGIHARIEQALAGKPVRYARIAPRRLAPLAAEREAALHLSDLSELGPQQLLGAHYLAQYGQPLPAALEQALAELLLDGAT